MLLCMLCACRVAPYVALWTHTLLHPVAAQAASRGRCFVRYFSSVHFEIHLAQCHNLARVHKKTEKDSTGTSINVTACKKCALQAGSRKKKKLSPANAARSIQSKGEYLVLLY